MSTSQNCVKNTWQSIFSCIPFFSEQHSFKKPYYCIVGLCIFSALYYSVPMLRGYYLRAWDAPTHIFFSQGYVEDWWSTWDNRWYGGYSKLTYPPLTHQIIAVLTFLTKDVNLSYALVLWGCLAIAPLSIYQFSRVWVDRRSSIIAAVLFLLAPAVRIMLFTHGQFPGFVCLLCISFAIRTIDLYTRAPHFFRGMAIVTLIGCCLSSHQATNVFFLVPLLALIYMKFLLCYPKEGASLQPWAILKSIVYISGGIAIGFPFIQWLFEFRMQTPIPHPSRFNLFQNFLYFRIFWLDNYGALLFIFPIVLWCDWRRTEQLLLVLSFLFFMALGLGGTTPLPAFIFGHKWEWLTYERFNVWAIVLLLPIIGQVISSKSNTIVTFISRITFVILVIFATVWLIVPEYKSTTSDIIDFAPVYDSLRNDSLCSERYLALGFGHQLPIISTHTSARTFDGLWHTARDDKFLRESGVGSLSDSIYLPNGENVLINFLTRDDIIPAYCIYINNIAPDVWKFQTILIRTGWYLKENFDNDVSLWKNDRFKEILDDSRTMTTLDTNDYAWGIAPITFLLIGIAIGIVTALHKKEVI